MKISVLGAGHVGGALGKAFTAAGHTVVFGVRHPRDEKYRALEREVGRLGCVNSDADAGRYSDTIVLAVPWEEVKDALNAAGDLSGKTIIDCTNAITPDYSDLALGADTSAAEEVAKWAPGAHVVKAFNHVGSAVMEKPEYPEGRAMALVCGDDARSKELTMGLAKEIGFDAFDAGPLRNARFMEALTMLWITLAEGGLGSEFAFGVLRR